MGLFRKFRFGRSLRRRYGHAGKVPLSVLELRYRRLGNYIRSRGGKA